jgi:hypothetical protein
VEEVELAVGRNDEQPARLRDGARPLGEERRARDADGDRQPDAVAHVAAQPRRDLGGRPGEALEPTDDEERLVDRQRLDERRRVLEHPQDRQARLRVRVHPGWHDDRVRAQSPRLALLHCGRTPYAFAS